MSWRDNLREASYRGIPFLVESAQFEGGVRTVSHTYPQRDEPLVEWLGRKVRQYKIEAFLVGDDYAENLKKLVAAIEKRPTTFPLRSSSVLVHPYLGNLRVVATGIRYKEVKSEGRMARVELSFVEAGLEPAPPITTGQQLGKAEKATEAADVALAENLEENLETTGVVEEVRAATADALRSVGNVLKDLDVFSGLTADVAALGFQTTQMINTAAGLAVAPATLATTFLGVLDGIDAAAGNALGALSAYNSLLGLSPALDGGTSVTALLADANALLVFDFMRGVTAGRAVQAAIQVEWESLDDALAGQGRITDQIDDLLERATDAVYPLLQDVRATAANGVPAPGQSLPSVVTLTLPGTVPALVLASTLYDQARREGEIVLRNRVRHPLFLPGLTPLEVLSG